MSGGTLIQKPHLKDVTLVSIDTTEKAHLAARAIEKSMEQADFGAVKLLTHDTSLPHAVKIRNIDGVSDYSKFVVRELHAHVQTSHCLIVQWDGWVTNGASWTDEFLTADYIGAPWIQWGGKVGNGGFSLRSKRLLEIASKLVPGEMPHPEDAWFCEHQRRAFEALGMRWAPTQLAARFAFEGRGYNGTEWRGTATPYSGSFGFHSFLSPLPDYVDAPLVFHHSGDAGDVIYSLAVARAMGGGTYFLSPDCKFPFPKAPRNCSTDSVAFCNNLTPLIRRQPYIWGCQPTAATPFSAHADFNQFRLAYARGGAENWKSLLQLHAQAFGVSVDGAEPWLECDDPISVPGRPIVVNLTDRYRQYEFPWWQLIRRYGHQMVFIGTPFEHAAFQGHAPDIAIPHFKTGDFWDVARVIKGAKCCVMNQSSCLAVAHGLGQRVIVEEWPQNPNCHFDRPGAIYWRGGGEITIPDDWLNQQT